jgi:transposase
VQIEIRGAERLSFRERQAVVLKETGHDTLAIAARLRIAPATVGTLLSRAKAKGYQVVIVIAGDPLSLFEGDEESGERPEAEADG